MDIEYKKKLNKELESGKCVAWLIKKENDTIARGAITFTSLIPVPIDPTVKVAFLHSVFTDVHHRKQGHCKKIIETAIEYCRSQGVKRLLLNTSKVAKSIYKNVGFRLSDNSMGIFIK